VEISEILARFQSVSETTDGYLALCPAHADSKPSLRLWYGEDGKVRLKCRAGCVPADVVRAAGLEWRHMFNATGAGVTVPKEPPVMVGPGPIAALRMYVDAAALNLFRFMDAGAEDAQEYAERRFGITGEIASDLMLGYDSGREESTLGELRSPSFRRYPRLTVPLRGFDGVVRGLQGRDLSGECPGRWVSLRNPEGARWAPYGVFHGQGGYGVTIVSEGPGDGLSVVPVGYDAVAIRGAALAGVPELLAELADGLRGTQVIAAGDADRAGQYFNRALAEGLAPFGIPVYALPIPAGVADVTAWRESDPVAFPEALHAAVKAASRVQESHVVAAEQRSAEITDRTGADVVSRDQGIEAARLLSGLIDRYGESDAMNAHALVAWTDGRIKYSPSLGFMVWNGRTWECSTVKVRQEIHRMGAALVLAGETQKARGFTMTTRIDALMTELRSVPTVHVAADAFDAANHLLSFTNGTVDLRTGALRPHDQRDLITQALDIRYIADAQAPRWESFLGEIFPGMPEMVPYIQRLVGYGITGCTDEQCFAVLWGKGANGKSVFTDTLTSVFRTLTKTTGFATFEEKPNGGIPNDIAALRNARMVMASEGEAGKPMSESVLKRATGKEMMSARFLRKEFFEFKPRFLIMLATNHKPRFKGQDEGLWRRVRLIPFTRWFAPAERDYDLDRKLLAEAEGIAAWAVRGAVDWYRGGLRDPEIVTAAGREYKETSDALAGFFPGILERGTDADQILGSDAFGHYLEWCEAENLPQKERWTRRAFYTAMEERGAWRKSVNKGVALMGLRLVSDPTAPAPGPGIFAK
jgi:putative DNA primase/helicase